MFKLLVVLALGGTMSVPAAAQTAQNAPATQAQQAQPAKPQMVKKRVCETTDNPYSRISRTCKTIMVPADPASSAANHGHPQPQAQQPNSGTR
jgi:hypothetical protein